MVTEDDMNALVMLTKPPDDMQDLTPDQLVTAAAQLGVIEGRVKMAKSQLAAMRERVFSALVSDHIDQVGYGSRTSEVDGFKIKISRTKSVSWDADKMRAIETAIREVWKKRPEDYMDVTRKISEKSWNAWPSDLQYTFAEARTVKDGALTITLEKQDYV